MTNAAQKLSFVLLLSGLSAMTALSIDITLPATGVVARDLMVAEKLGAMLVGVYFLAYAVGQLFWGLLSDAFGRRKVLLSSLALFMLASVGCALASDFWWLIAFRALQGLAGGAPVVARAMVRDVARGDAAAKLLAVLMGVTAIAPMLAPVIGAGLMELFAWRAIFVFLALFSAAMLFITFLFGIETAKNTRPERFSISFVIHAVGYLFRQRDFLIGTAVSSLTFAGYASVLSLGAVVAEQAYDVQPAAFGAIFAIGAIFIFSGTMLVRFLVSRIGLKRIGSLAIVVLGVASLINAALFFSSPSLPVFWAGACIYMFAFGIILPSAQAFAMEPAGEMPGFASSLLGSLLMVAGAMGAGLAAVLFDGSHSAISGTMAIFGFIAVACFLGARLYDRIGSR